MPDILIHDNVVFKRHPGAHEEQGVVFSRTIERVPHYDIETTEGERVLNMEDVRPAARQR